VKIFVLLAVILIPFVFVFTATGKKETGKETGWLVLGLGVILLLVLGGCLVLSKGFSHLE
jgi:hypothetical protein